jgi:hypothetical protein
MSIRMLCVLVIAVVALLSEYFKCTFILMDLTVVPTLSLNTQKHINTSVHKTQ